MASTLVQFIKSDVKLRYYSQYSQGSVVSFATQFVIDWGFALPNGGLGLGVVAKPGAATVAEVVVAPGICLELNPLDWIGYNFQTWEVVPAASMARTVADGATNSNNNFTSATAAFNNPLDVGARIAGAGIPGGTTVLSVTSGTQVVLSANATATATGVPVTITRTSNLYIPDVI